MEQPSDTKPHMFAIEFESPMDRPSFTVVLIDSSPRHALEQALWMFPGFRRTFPKGHVQEVAFVDIDWDIGMAFVAKRKLRPPMLLMDVYGQKKWAGGVGLGDAGVGQALYRRDWGRCGIAESNAFGITTVITLCHEPVRIRRGGVNYLNFPVGEVQTISAGQLDAILDAIWENIRWGRLLVADGNGARSGPGHRCRMDTRRWLHGYRRSPCRNREAANH